MSLQIAAKHLAAKGRGPDTTLVHMTNKEVQGLQALAEKNGGSLSINPDTGLPEAGFLESILPLVAGVGLSAAGMPAGYAALTVGGVTALSTGSLSKGLYAGLGAYGGASLGQQLAVQGMGEAAAANASFGDKLAGMGDAPAFASMKGAGEFISANKLPAMAGIAGPLLSSMEDERENDKPAEPVKDTDPGARARSGIKFNPGYMTPTPLPNPYGIEQTYATPYYAAEGGVTHMAEGGMAYGGSTSGPIDTKAQFADYLNKVMNPTNRTNAVSGSTNPYEWWKSPSTPEAAPAAPTETAEEYAARTRANARGSSGGQSQEQKDQREADLDRVDDYLSTPENQVTMRQYWAMDKEARDKLNADAAERNPIRGAIYEGVTKLGYPMFLRGAEALQGVIKDFTGPSTKDPKSVGMVFPTEKDRIKAEEVAKYRQALLGDTSPYINNVGENQNVGPGTPEFNAARQAAIPSAGPNMYIGSSLDPYSPIDRVTATDAANAAYQRKQADAAEQARMEKDTIASDYGYNQGLAIQQGIAANPFSPQNPDKALRNAYYQSYPRVGTTPEAQQAAIDNLTSDSFYAAKPDYTPESIQQADAALAARLSAAYPADIANTQTADFAALAPMREYNAALMAKLNKEAEARQNAALSADFNKIAETPMLREQLNRLNLQSQTDAENNAERGDRFAPLPFAPIAAPDIVGINEIKAEADPNADNYARILKAFDPNNTDVAKLSLDPGSLLAAGEGYTGGVSDGSPLAGLQGGYNPGYATPNMGYGQSRGAFGIGGVWTNKEGIPIRTGDGSLVMTGEGAAAMERAVAESNTAANRTYGNAPEGRTGRDATAGDGYGGGYGAVAPGYTGGSEAADGGLSTPYGFQHMANGGLSAMATPYDLGSYSDGGRLLKGPGDGVSDSIPATIGKGRPARLADGEFVIPARIVSEIGNGSTEAGARKLYAMMDRIQASRSNTVGKGKVAVNNRADKYLPA